MRGLIGVLVALAFAACDDGGAAVDGLDAAAQRDVAEDIAVDATVDTRRPDVVPDAAPDVGPDAAPPARDHPAQRPPVEALAEPGVRREYVEVEGFEAPPNPETGSATPPELNRIGYTRYYAEGEPAPRAIVVGMPGILAGAGSLDPLARAVVKRAAEADRPVEVWALDRRANGLEDLRGLNTAEVMGDPEIAAEYYFGDGTIDGEPFAGFVDQDALDYMSEWGLAVHVEDVRRVVHQVPEPLRRGHVFLMGHSLGAMFAELYAGWAFADGTTGAQELAGLILLDGAVGADPISEEEWRTGSFLGIFAQPGVDELRVQGPRYLEIPLIGIKVYVLAEIMALRILQDPLGVVEDAERDRMLGLLMTRAPNQIPPLTNMAGLGFGFGFAHNPLAFARIRAGEPDGPLEDFTNLLGEAGQRPPISDALYGWVDALDAEPPGFTPLGLFSEALSAGVTNFAEWYFPQRLSVDINAAGGVALAEDSWQFAQGIRAVAGPRNDAPILSVAGDLFRVPQMSGVVDRVAPTVGEGRPAAGATRDDPAGWTLVDATFMAHLDITLAADAPGNPVPGAVDAFVARHAAAGTVELMR